MNVYEEAHNLSKAIKESEEYKQYKAASDKIKENPQKNLLNTPAVNFAFLK